MFFYKALPLTLANSEHRLGVFNLSFEDYKANFLKKDDLLPSSQRDKMLENHPQEDELREFLQQEGALILDEYFFSSDLVHSSQPKFHPLSVKCLPCILPHTQSSLLVNLPNVEKDNRVS